ncbi:MAG: glycosyltransferase, partial [Methanomicrobiaceae archaeon]|nr:glycosyltransferase [Methanomicrobiaceae archaeon]
MISVIVPAKNEAESIRVCLHSLRSQHLDGEDAEIIVVDGNSTDGTRKIAKTHADRYAYGHFHYQLMRDYQRLLNYPRFDEMDLEVILDVFGAGGGDTNARPGAVGRLGGRKKRS